MNAEGMPAGIFDALRSARGAYRAMCRPAERRLPPAAFAVESQRR